MPEEGLKEAEKQVMDLKEQLAASRGERDALSEELASVKGMLTTAKGSNDEGEVEGEAGRRELELIEAVAKGKREAGVREGVIERLKGELERARLALEQAEAREGVAQSQAEGVQKAYVQARKYIEDLEGWKEEKGKEIQELKVSDCALFLHVACLCVSSSFQASLSHPTAHP